MAHSRFFLAAACLALVASAPACSKPRADHGAGEAAEPGKEPFGKLTMDELETRMADAKGGKIKLALFDNNQHERFMKSHLPGAHWVKFDDVKASDLPADKETNLVFYCSNEH
jgi:hypothetical protein